MKTNRPKIEVPFEPLDIIVDLISLTLFILMFIYTTLNYGDLAETIPTHINAAGEADGFSDKIYVWLLPAIGIITFVLLFVLNKYPQIHSYMVNITEDNALKNYRFSTRILRFTNLFVAVIFVFTQYMMIEKGKGHDIIFGSWFTAAVIGVSVILTIFTVIYQRKLNKNDA
ncbi:MAG: putative membrane protein [Glaciecola sp.]|jgi:uncharacterized membrane protein